MKIRMSAWWMVCGLALFVAGALWGVWFAFPEPDAGAERLARMRVHDAAASSAMLSGLACLLVGAIAAALSRWRRRRRGGSAQA